MPVRYCRHCIWGLVSVREGRDGIECTNPKLEGVQKGNVMPLNARACNLYTPAKQRKK